MLEIIVVKRENVDQLAELVAAFRVELKGFKGISATPDRRGAAAELNEYLDAGYPVYAALEEGGYAGYVVCRVEEPTVWIESIYVAEASRRRGVATDLLRKAEQVANAYGEDTVFNFVHPNNDRMIAFLRKHGYTVLNLIEIRKPYPGEALSATIKVGNHEFDY